MNSNAAMVEAALQLVLPGGSLAWLGQREEPVSKRVDSGRGGGRSRAPSTDGEVATATDPRAKEEEESRRRRLTPNAAVVEAAPLGREGEVALATEASGRSS